MCTQPFAVSKALLIVILLLLCLPAAIAQTPHSRIAQPIDESRLIVLSGNTRPEVSARNDRGRVPDGLQMEHMFLQLRRSPEQEQALKQFIDELHDRKSSNFHHWLTADEFGQRYGLAAEDLATISGWLRSHDFVVNVVYPNGIVIDFSGTARQVRNAFHTEIHYLDVKGIRHIANMRDPQIPSALAPAVVGIVALNDFRPRPAFTYTGASCGLLPTQPLECYSVVPADLATVYGFNPLFAKGISGQGQTIVVLEPTDVFSTADWTTFRSAFGLSSYTSGSFSQIHPPNATANNCNDPGLNANEDEAILDAEWASASAPNAAIVLASCDDTATNFGVFIALENLLNTSASPPAIMSLSYTGAELELGTTGNAHINSDYQQAVAEGVSVFVAAGDDGADVLDGNGPATDGINVNGLASTPFNVAVGGTDFGDSFSGTNSTYWGATNSSTFGSALSYIPEIPWNDSCASTLIATSLSGSAVTYGANGFCNSIVGDALFLTDSAGGGGPSACANGSFIDGTCAPYPKPSWQSVLGNPNDGVRDVPDVSLFAASGVWGHAYIVCWSDPAFFATGGAAPCNGTPDTWSRFGGTSVAAPILAGVQALVNQKTGSRWGNPNPTYYSLATAEYGNDGNSACNSTLGNKAAGSCVFYDITQGDTDVPCVSGSVNCYAPSGPFGVLSTSDSTYAPAFAAHSGWDFATGIGTINVTNLVNGWTSAKNFGKFSLSSNPASVDVAASGASGSSTITVTGTNGFTGSVMLTCSVSPVPANSAPACVVFPFSVALNSTTTSATATLQITTTAGLGSSLERRNLPIGPAWFGAIAGAALVCIFLFSKGRPKRRTVFLMFVGLVFLGAAFGGCASQHGGSSQINLGTPAGNYAATVTATSGDLTQSTTVSVTVQ